MADVVSREKRSRMMSGIRGANTRPEILIRKVLFSRGFRYRIHGRKLPGSPDIVLPRWNAVVFVHGCFWHQHDCHLFKMPSSRREFWQSKLSGNVARDARNEQTLREAGWRVATVWECALKGKTRIPIEQVASSLDSWIRSQSSSFTIQGKNMKQSENP